MTGYRLTIDRFVEREESAFGDLRVWDFGRGLLEPVFEAVSAERRWADNEPFVSCVPAGFYVLEPHNGTKYRDTWALIGDTVSHTSEEGVPRSACVLHWASSGKGLQGCVSAGHELQVSSRAAALEGKAIGAILELLNARRGPHYLTIR